METVLVFVLKSIVRKGTLKLQLASGRNVDLGDGTGDPISVRFMTPHAQWQILIDPDLNLGEAFADGALRMEQGSIADLLALLLAQDHPAMRPVWSKILYASRYLLRRSQQSNGRRRSKSNAHHHYDLDDRLYDLFLDADRQYSCGYFERCDQPLDDAQLAKKRHIAVNSLAITTP